MNGLENGEWQDADKREERKLRREKERHGKARVKENAYTWVDKDKKKTEERNKLKKIRFKDME